MDSRSVALRDARRGVARHRGRGRAARGAAERGAEGSVRPAGAAGARDAAGGDPLRPSELSLALQRHPPDRRPLADGVRGRSGPLGRRALVGARGPHADALGRGLRAREPAYRAPGAAGIRAVDGHPPAERFLLDAARRAVAPRGRGAARGGAHAGHVQRNLLRARLSRAPARRTADRGPRPDGARGMGVLEDPRGAEARARDPAQARRRLLRSGGIARRLRARRAGPARRHPRRQRRARQRPRQRGARVRGLARVSAGCGRAGGAASRPRARPRSRIWPSWGSRRPIPTSHSRRCSGATSTRRGARC